MTRCRWRWAVVAAGVALTVTVVGLGVAVGAGVGAARPAGAQPVDDDNEGSFYWDDPVMKRAFGECLDVVSVVAHGSARLRDAPEGVDGGLWRRAINSSWLAGIHIQQFSYRPHCEVLLPRDYEARIPYRFWSETFTRCRANVAARQRTHERPEPVPAWYWEVSLATGHCYLLLPLGAFELGDDTNAWSAWTSEDETDYPTSHENPAVVEAHRLCTEYIQWRMNGAATFAGLGSLYDDPPEGSVPSRVWQEALHYFRDPVAKDLFNRTLPDDWRPNCRLLLLSHPCDPKASEAIVPELCVGPHATSQYDIGYSEYDDKEEEGDKSISRTLWGASTGFAYFLGKGAVHVSLWLVDWGYTFNIAQLNPLARDIGNRYQANLVDDPVGQRLQDLFWLILVSWVGIAALRGRLAMAGGELLVTVVMLLVATVLIDNRTYYMNRTWELMTESSNTLLAAGLKDSGTQESEWWDEVSAGGSAHDSLVTYVQRRIHRIFVEDTYDYLNWGQALGEANDADNPLRACAAARYYIVDQGPHASDTFPRDRMRAAGQECEPLAEFNRNPSGTRLMGAILMMVSAIAVAILLGLMALTIIVGKFIALLLFAVAPLAVMVAVLPGPGRKLAWSWGAALIQVLLAVIGMSFLLSLLLLALVAVTAMTADVPLIERFLLMNLIVFVVFAARRNLLASGQRLAGRLGEYMSAARGSGTTWATAGAASPGQGLNMLQVDRAALIATGAPASVAGAHVLRRITERRVARRGYRNLQRLAYWKRERNAASAHWRARHRMPIERAPVRRQPLP